MVYLMKKVSEVIFLKYITLLIVFLSYSLFSIGIFISGGYSLLENTGWSFGLGFSDKNFEALGYLTFDLNKEISENASPVDLYDFKFTTSMSFDVENIKFGPLFVAHYENYPEEDSTNLSWMGDFGLGVVSQIVRENFDLSLGLWMPFDGNFNARKNVYVKFRYYIPPPGGKSFKDKLFLEVMYLFGGVRIGFGLWEPVP